MSIRQTIIDSLAARLADITVANGYSTDAGQRVFVWRRYALDQVEVPCFLVTDGKNARRTEAAVIGSESNALAVTIIGVTGKDAPAGAGRSMEADVTRCLLDPDNGWNANGLAETVMLNDSEITLEQHENGQASILMNWTVVYIAKIAEI